MKKELINKALDDGQADCPCCGTTFRVYKRKLNKNMAAFVAGLWVLTNDLKQDFHHRDAVKSVLNFHLGNDYQMARHWGLIEPHEMAGYWKLTEYGAEFASGATKCAEYTLILDNEKVATGGDYVDIKHCLGVRFRLAEIFD